jgi:hypothetical protein
LVNLDAVSQLHWSFDSSLNIELSDPEYYTSKYDPVREAAAQNAETSSSHTNSTKGGPSQPQGGENPSIDSIRQDTDTKYLADYLSLSKGNSVYNCGLERKSIVATTPQKIYLSRI